MGYCVFGFNFNYTSVSSILNFNYIFFGILLPYDYLDRYPDKVRIFKFYSRGNIPVIKEHLIPRFCKVLINLFGYIFNLFARDIQGDYDDPVRGYRDRPYYAVFVVTRFDQRRYYSGNSDAVTAHDGGDGLPVLLEDLGAEYFRIFCPKLESMPYLYGAFYVDLFPASGASVIFCYDPYVGNDSMSTT